MALYPCKECIIKCNCSKFCDKVIGTTLLNYIMTYKECPDCGCTKFIAPTEWPEGAILINCVCNDCNSLFKFNQNRDFAWRMYKHRAVQSNFTSFTRYELMSIDYFIKHVFNRI